MNTPPASLLHALRSEIGLLHGALRIETVSGGSIHDAFRLRIGEGETSGRSVFLKVARDAARAASLRDESEGLRVLGALEGVRVPEVLSAGTLDGWTWLALPWIHSAPAARAGKEAGEHVARLHAHRRERWGHVRDNAIATLTQQNTQSAEGLVFWAANRLRAPALAAHREKGLADADLRQILALADAIETGAAPAQRPPVQLHGDLWGGNLMIDEAGHSWLIDPAVYAGDPRIDLAMARLFGGFSPDFFAAWEAVHGSDPGDAFWQHAYTVWPLLVHARLFGGGYGASAGREATHALRRR